MIRQRQGDGWRVITQRTHALLASKMLFAWREDKRVEPWFELLNACSHHDHGWEEDFANVLVDEEGQPLDFLHVPILTALGMARRAVSGAASQSRVGGLLVARHVEFLYKDKESPEALGFLAEVRARIECWKSALDLDETALEKLYELLLWADSLSLKVCCSPSDFADDLALEAQGETFTANLVGDDEWTLSPWPFAEAQVVLDYESRRLDKASFFSPEALRDALRGAPVRLHTVVFKPG